MPSKTPAQKRLMAAAAHTKGGFGGVSQKVGKEFNQADKKAYNKGGSVSSKEQVVENQKLEQAAVSPTLRVGKGGKVAR